MFCPKCKVEVHCGCKSCAIRNKGKVLFFDAGNDLISCGNCQHTMCGDDWLDEEWNQYQVMKDKNEI